MNKLKTGIAALALAATPAVAQSQAPCMPADRVEALYEQIPQHFPQVRPGTFLIDENPAARFTPNGGQMTVYMGHLDPRVRKFATDLLYPGEQPVPLKQQVSIFDKRSDVRRDWYNVANEEQNPGCATDGSYIDGQRGDIPQPQQIFNEAIRTIYEAMDPNGGKSPIGRNRKIITPVE